MKREIKIGVFTILMIITAWGGLKFLSGLNLFSSNNVYYASYSAIDGVQSASPIYLKGVKVGSVTGISLAPSRDAEVCLELTIDGVYNLPKDSEAMIAGSGLMNPKAINIILGESSEYLESGDQIKSSSEVDILAVAGSELESLTQKIDEVATELSSTLHNLNIILESNTDNIGSALSNLEALSANLNTLIAENRKSLDSMLGGFAEVGATMGDNAPKIDSIIRNADALMSELSQANIGSSIDEALSGVNSILEQLNSAEGSAGKILNDEELYANLTSASANLDSLLYDLKENPSRYVNISVFGSNESKSKLRAEKRLRKETEEAEKDALKAAAKSIRKGE